MHNFPEIAFPRVPADDTSKLDFIGFEMEYSNFSFSFSVNGAKSELTTANRNLYISDRFSELGMLIPSRNCFGLGERNSKFKVSSGYYTMYPSLRADGMPADDALGGKGGNHIIPVLQCIVTEDFKPSSFGLMFISSSPIVIEILDT